MFKKLAMVLATMGAAAGGYLLFIRPWQLRLGATDEEVACAMPGDDVVRHPTFNATRAVTIKARPEEIWPWLVQVDLKWAGWYSYDWLDNLGHHSAEWINPEFQHLAVGDRIPMSPDGKQGPVVKDLDPNQWMLWGDTEGDFTWYWGLYPLDEKQTRYAQSNGLAIYRFGQGEPILFMPYPHAASVVGDAIPTTLITGLEQAGREVITFDPPGAGSSTRPGSGLQDAAYPF